MSENKCIERKRTKFAEAALKEIRKHHGSTIRRDILGYVLVESVQYCLLIN
uniref:Uncharacterized protein n=1 Tax=Nelumbo nucifera TaxID=4432 RepID=A0A822ZEE9_NELNU|nr:TPA_asm: hypothetical protein HUJ06_001173 [Nelumbo nucifera]